MGAALLPIFLICGVVVGIPFSYAHGFVWGLIATYVVTVAVFLAAVWK